MDLLISPHCVEYLTWATIKTLVLTKSSNPSKVRSLCMRCKNLSSMSSHVMPCHVMSCSIFVLLDFLIRIVGFSFWLLFTKLSLYFWIFWRREGAFHVWFDRPSILVFFSVSAAQAYSRLSPYEAGDTLHCISLFCFILIYFILLHFILLYSSSDNIKSNYIMQHKWFYWWRAVSASFYLRPNAATLEAIDKHSTLPLHSNNEKQALSFPNNNNGQCISLYIRSGDKSQEMNIVPFSSYIEAVEVVMDRFLNTSGPRAPGKKGKPAIFIGTESSEALLETIAWGEKNDYQVSYIPMNGDTEYDIKTVPGVWIITHYPKITGWQVVYTHLTGRNSSKTGVQGKHHSGTYLLLTHNVICFIPSKTYPSMWMMVVMMMKRGAGKTRNLQCLLIVATTKVVTEASQIFLLSSFHLFSSDLSLPHRSVSAHLFSSYLFRIPHI